MSCHGGEITPASHFPEVTSCRTLVRTCGFITSCWGSKLRVKYITTQPQMISRLLHHIPRSTEHVERILPSHASVSRWIRNRFVSKTSARRSISNLFRSGRGRELCYRPLFCTSCRVLETRTRSMLAPRGQQVADSLTPAFIHDDRPIADPCLGQHSSLGNCDHDRPQGEKWHKQWGNISLFQFHQL